MRKTSKRNNRSKRYRTALLVVCILLVVGGASGAALWHYHKTHKNQRTNSALSSQVNTINYGPSKKNDNTANDTRKSSPTPATTLNNGSSSATNTALSAQIVSASASASNIHIGTMISGTTTGTCTITATQGQTTVTLDTVSVKQDVNYYDCGGGAINASTSQLNPDTGTWQLKLTVTSDGTQATSTSSVTL